MKIFLVGFMGSGKTTIGKRLAAPIGFEFIDTDRVIEEKYGMTVGQIFADRGEMDFRQIEHHTLHELLPLDYTVIATGGGMPCHHDNMDTMLSNGKVVYLKTSPQALAKRLMRSWTERPLIKGKSEKELQQYIEEKLAEREPCYCRAHIIIDTEYLSTEKLLQSLHLIKS